MATSTDPLNLSTDSQITDLTTTDDTPADIDALLQQFVQQLNTDSTDFRAVITQCRALSKRLLIPSTTTTTLCAHIDTHLSSDTTPLPHRFALFELFNHCLLLSRRLGDTTHSTALTQFIEFNAYKYILLLLPQSEPAAQPYVEPVRKIVRMWQERQYVKKTVLLNVLKYIDAWKLPVQQVQSPPSSPSQQQSTSPKRKRSKLHATVSSKHHSDVKPERVVHQPTAEEVASTKYIEDIRAQQKQQQYAARLRPANEPFYAECNEMWRHVDEQPMVDHGVFMQWFTDTSHWTVDPLFQPQQPIAGMTEASPAAYTPLSPMMDDSPQKRLKHEMLKAPQHSPSLLRKD